MVIQRTKNFFFNMVSDSCIYSCLEPQRRRKVDSSSEDDDEFYDRTTEAEEKRKRKAGNDETGAMSYEQLVEKQFSFLFQLISHIK